MAEQRTPRMNLPYYQGTDPPAGMTQQQALASELDSKAAIFLHGPIASRPSSTPSSPGKAGRLYYATDTAILYYDTGIGWLTLTNVGLVADGDPNVATLRSLGAGAQQAAAGNDARLSNARAPIDNTVTTASLNTSLKPSTGASADTEAVRALGTAAGKAAPGTHAQNHRWDGPDPLPATPGGLLDLGLNGTPTALLPNGTTSLPLNFVSGPTGIWSSANPGRIIFPKAGSYLVGLQVTGDANGVVAIQTPSSFQVTTLPCPENILIVGAPGGGSYGYGGSTIFVRANQDNAYVTLALSSPGDSNVYVTNVKAFVANA